MEALPDHVPLLMGCDPQCVIRRLLKLLKGYSAQVLRAEFLPSSGGCRRCGRTPISLPRWAG